MSLSLCDYQKNVRIVLKLYLISSFNILCLYLRLYRTLMLMSICRVVIVGVCVCVCMYVCMDICIYVCTICVSIHLCLYRCVIINRTYGLCSNSNFTNCIKII